jgi:hypothetical protein
MKRYRGGDTVERGIYLNVRRLAAESMQERGALPGTEEVAYCRLPTLAVALAAPLLGGIYLVLLPVIGFVVLAGLAMARGFQLIGGAALRLVRVLRPTWTPAGALLGTGRPAGNTSKHPDGWSKAVEKQLADGTREAVGDGPVPSPPLPSSSCATPTESEK